VEATRRVRMPRLVLQLRDITPESLFRLSSECISRSSFHPVMSRAPAIPTIYPSDVRQRRTRRVAVGIILLLVVISAFVGAKPAYHQLKRLQAANLDRQAERLIEKKEWRMAIDKAQAAYRLAPLEPGTIRTMARLFTAAGVPNSLTFWRQLLGTSGATMEDRRQAASAALRFSEPAFAAEQVDILLKSEPARPENVELAALVAIQKRDTRLALEHLDKLLRLNPNNQRALLTRAQLLFASTTRRAEGERILRELAATTGPMSLGALEALSRAEGAPREEQLANADALDAHPDATVQHHLLAATLRLRASPDRKPYIVDQMVERYQEGDDDAIATLGRWLMMHGETQRAAFLIPETVAAKRQDLFLVRVDALGALGRWEDLQVLLERQDAPIDPLQRSVFLARASRELGLDRGAEAHWTRAFAAAGSDPQKLIFLAHYCEKIGAWIPAEKAWRELARNPKLALQAYFGLLRVLEPNGNTSELREIVRQITVLAPDNKSAKNDLAYLDLLLNENTDAAIKTSEELIASDPRVLAPRVTLALGHLRKGDTARAAAVVKEAEVAWEKANPGWRAVRAAVLAANGELKAEELESIPQEPLKPEERALLEAAKSGSGTPAQEPGVAE
jgi:tetratricopeptide (TPR) repeat protein